jgi:hypothetical protein
MDPPMEVLVGLILLCLWPPFLLAVILWILEARAERRLNREYEQWKAAGYPPHRFWRKVN